jgi:hypothetical protein
MALRNGAGLASAATEGEAQKTVGVGKNDAQTSSPLKTRNQATRQARVRRQLEILALRSLELADRVAAGELHFLDAVDVAYDAAIWADLPNAIDASGFIDVKVISGNDIVQATIAAAFANARAPA